MLCRYSDVIDERLQSFFTGYIEVSSLSLRNVEHGDVIVLNREHYILLTIAAVLFLILK